MARVVAVVSGGLDSVVLAYHLHQEGHDLQLLSINYGQRHRKEHDFASLAARRIGALHDELDLSNLSAALPGYSLTDPSVEVPDQHYTQPGSVNVVPNRNVILFSVAFGHAAALRADQVAVGAIAGDDATAPDCSAKFIASFNAMEEIATAGYAPPHLRVVAPFIRMTKGDVILRGQELGVDFSETWSCFKGQEVQCGVCAACEDRRLAFSAAGVVDPTLYKEGS
ncbi:7-cyano-7-deazaguanine synthase [Streptomyces anthocyanicus]|uniref:7-cyano-7-deazaguanine synthase n=1 Tax=Streptomyces TaxID=1883 RepID=UPI00087D32F2|nr:MULTISPECIES: 7-cyano-7-deazaguanine synthase [Streptomyces]REH24930.1 7-cyano-7-deazaguanine synthase [Streptomyces sp. 2221.1]GGL84873.1 7-cyano-7-deazaguanine synthase [Streptomyces anthocyanicus]SDT79875.1 7-cyano-7-deazaguanine synthase [Streptomyces sp. 2114.2]